MVRRIALGLLLLLLGGVGGDCCALLKPALVIAADDVPAVTIEDVQIGVGGHFKAGCWTPIRVTLAGPAGSTAGVLEVETPDSDGIHVVYRASQDAPVVFPATGRLTATAYARFGRVRSELTVRVRNADGGELARKRLSSDEAGRGWPPQQLLLVSLGPAWIPEESLRSLDRDSQSVTLAVVADATELPERWIGWEGVDAVLLSTSAPTFVEQLPDKAFQALDQWLRLGGRMVWSVGARGDAVFGGESRFQAWNPGTFVEVGSLRRTSALESYAGAAQRLELSDGRGRDQRVAMTQLDDVRGRIEAPEGGLSGGDHPIVVRYPIGLGQATLVTLDIDQPPLSDWSGRTRVLSRILQRGRERAKEAGSDQMGQVSHLGFDDLTGQLRGALDQYAGVTVVAFSWVATLLVVYVLLIGPGDYFFVRLIGRPHWTWLTLAATIAVFVVVAYALSARWKEPRLRMNSVQIVDYDADSQLERGTGWFNLYSPRSDRYALDLSPAESQGDDVLGWQGLPGRGLGGLSASNVSTLLEDLYHVDLHAPSAVRELPIQVGATKSLSARWHRPWKFDSKDNRLTSVSLDEQLQGDFRNPVPVRLTDWFLLYGNWLYRGDRQLEPGDLVVLSDFPATRYLDWHLTRRSVSTDHKDVTTPWDQADQDVPRICDLLMFHEAAGGTAYTRLQHRYQSYVDLSDHLRTGRAILMGRAADPARPLRRDGQSLADATERAWTFYRVVLPVKIRKPTAAGVRRSEP
ncbi:MAG: hypothetical protein U0939_17025 [Pirellulales bacterium]